MDWPLRQERNQEEQERRGVGLHDGCVPVPAEVRSSEEGLLKVLGAFEAAEGLSAAGLDKVRVSSPNLLCLLGSLEYYQASH